ncbi:MAG: DUF3500 domain-containing protein [Pirellulaceae bacterium]|jgi:hypothetical protein|nr:DUF3500 domain-containing protein [Pirellulaceae bacterium]
MNKSKEIIDLDRRRFLKVVSSTAATGSVLWSVPPATAAPTVNSSSETAVKALYESLTDQQKKVVAFDWDHKHPKRGLLRTHVSNNWHITKPGIASDFFTKQQQMLIHDAFKSLFTPQWYKKMLKQGREDSGQPWGERHNIAIFGKPGEGKFEMVFTGRHMTIRADGNTQSHVALGGPRVHGHSASGFDEKVGHPGNVFWHQALEANKVYEMLSGKQRKQALVENLPTEEEVGFQGSDGRFSGIPISELSGDQNEQVKKVLMSLVEPYRKEDRDEIAHSLKQQGGLEKCSLAFYQEGDLGDDQEWDNWRIEGPAFVWYFRGFPHVHIWINIADDPKVKLNSQQL